MLGEAADQECNHQVKVNSNDNSYQLANTFFVLSAFMYLILNTVPSTEYTVMNRIV